MTEQYPTVAQAKDLAKKLRLAKGSNGTAIGHAQSLEQVAHQHGFRDWNTMLAAIGNGAPKGWSVGEKVSGTYLSQFFSATVVSVRQLKPGWFRVELDLNEPVDVVSFESFSNFRKRIRGTVGPKGHSVERTSDWEPHLQIDLG
ncbi:glyoxalase superfamily protein [Octadecabacter ascidiaceicola]|uniref:Glyoxalase-related protein domain-containing protein n=1 Tax=Octadecabacter ascidiaceicola TaxID=1655543 RepID=A0A238K3X8_9RHOB|nr:glyoxalase superfamily protein [Octadecabacter ascidiaceicola]SMX36812.1 hypothetical protein OCA8868_01115 [Octadecabacter ascidiaceicola]